ncbi:preprotein translocase subunit SecG [Geomicrobium halophilum]|uniref:Preprotein translocase subunit SecG n=1 Tax=Geomicrobium halophilum TaxID=549000 RepID=A0A841PWW3_9BACL|nr:hypothetical protein [Geomicrobium halophilum]MBB6451041.1 preprotein translocase subunit SecG [Geomicrobium halophilum]
MQKMLERLFTISLVLSLTLAFLMILLQMIGLVIGDGQLMVQASEWLTQPTIILAAVFSGIAFILGYFPKYRESKG